MWIRIKDFLFAMKECLAVWFVPNKIIERRINFLETGVTDKGKKAWAYKMLHFAYAFKLKQPCKIFGHKWVHIRSGGTNEIWDPSIYIIEFECSRCKKTKYIEI